MAEQGGRLNAVIGALEQLRVHVDMLDGDTQSEPSGYNRWIGMLDGVVEGSWQSLKLDPEEINADEYLMHIDAAIAFLQEHAKD